MKQPTEEGKEGEATADGEKPAGEAPSSEKREKSATDVDKEKAQVSQHLVSTICLSAALKPLNISYILLDTNA